MISPQNNLELHLGCHACWLSYFTSVYLWCGRTVGRAYGYVITKLPNFLTHGAPLRACGAPLQQEIPQQSFGVSTFLYGEQNKFYKSGDLFCLLFTLLAAIFSSCRFTNQPNRGKSRGFRASVSSFLVTIPPRFFISFAHHIYIVILVLQQIGVNRLLQFPSMISGLLEFKVSSQRFKTDVSYLWLLLGVLTQLEEIGRKIKSYIRVDSLIGGINTYISQLVLD